MTVSTAIEFKQSGATDDSGWRDYSLYGLVLRSEIKLTYAGVEPADAPDIVIAVRSAEWFDGIRSRIAVLDCSSGWYEHADLPDSSEYLRWPSLFEFVVSADGVEIAAQCLDTNQLESFQTYLLSWVVSCALLKQGYEPLHGTAVIVDGKAVALLGTSGQGKSTLAAAFLHAGYGVLTDDLLMIRRMDGVFHAFPGPPRVKLFPDVADRYQPHKLPLGPMNPDSDKIIVPLAGHETHAVGVPMRGFVVLETPYFAGPVVLDALSAHQSLLALIAATFNDRVRTPARLQRQFRASTEWARSLTVRRARYPRTLDAVACVRDAIVREVCAGLPIA